MQARGHRSAGDVRFGFASDNPSGSCSASKGVCNAAELACKARIKFGPFKLFGL